MAFDRRAYLRKWRAANPDKVRRINERYYRTEACKEARARYYRKHRGETLAKARDRRLAGGTLRSYVKTGEPIEPTWDDLYRFLKSNLIVFPL